MEMGDALLGDTVEPAAKAPVLNTTTPQFSPALPVVAALGGQRTVAGKTAIVWPGAVLLAANGAIFAVGGAPYLGGANVEGTKLAAGRKAVRLVAFGARGYSVIDNEGQILSFGS
jgi:hypothetical protein